MVKGELEQSKCLAFQSESLEDAFYEKTWVRMYCKEKKTLVGHQTFKRKKKKGDVVAGMRKGWT